MHVFKVSGETGVNRDFIIHDDGCICMHSDVEMIHGYEPFQICNTFSRFLKNYMSGRIISQDVWYHNQLHIQ